MEEVIRRARARGMDLTAEESTATEETRSRQAPGAAARKRAAAELVARHGGSLRQTARRYSLCVEDAEDAYQRALEILLTKAPTENLRELIRWTHTVVKHEALAVRRNRERLLGTPPPRAEDGSHLDWLELIPSGGEGPEERLELGERIARSREALQALKPAELRALTLLAEGYSYAEIGELTGFSATKVNRCLAEGRERFRRIVAGSEDGSRCREMLPLLSAVCDGEASADQQRAVREHLRACSACRATMRAYRAAAPAAAALAPALPASPSLWERAGELLEGLRARLPGGGAESAATQVTAAGAAKGAGAATAAKVLVACAGAAGGAAACVATGVAPAPLDPLHETRAPTLERISPAVVERAAPEPVDHAPAPPAPPQRPSEPDAEPSPRNESPPPAPTSPEPPPVESGAVEYAPPPEAAPPPPTPESSAGDSPAGEFGP